MYMQVLVITPQMTIKSKQKPKDNLNVLQDECKIRVLTLDIYSNIDDTTVVSSGRMCHLILRMRINIKLK